MPCIRPCFMYKWRISFTGGSRLYAGHISSLFEGTSVCSSVRLLIRLKKGWKVASISWTNLLYHQEVSIGNLLNRYAMKIKNHPHTSRISVSNLSIRRCIYWFLRPGVRVWLIFGVYGCFWSYPNDCVLVLRGGGGCLGGFWGLRPLLVVAKQL